MWPSHTAARHRRPRILTAAAGLEHCAWRAARNEYKRGLHEHYKQLAHLRDSWTQKSLGRTTGVVADPASSWTKPQHAQRQRGLEPKDEQQQQHRQQEQWWYKRATGARDGKTTAAGCQEPGITS